MSSKVGVSHLPREYVGLADDELNSRILEAKNLLGEQLVVLGHHYQRDEIIQYADLRGDSLKLAQYAADRSDAKYIVFCGVHFMAESADVLSSADQTVILPNMSAGCSMADMAPTTDVLACWEELQRFSGLKGDVLPVTYMNSAAALKAFCGFNGGLVCTSSNARAVIDWGFEQRGKVLFFPDQHLGRNTAHKMGYGPDEMVVWDPFQPLGGNTEAQLEEAKVLLWKGHCSVHKRFTVSQINDARERFPSVQVVVHPECEREVVEISDYDGSTEFIAKLVTDSPDGSVWGIGTEINLVNRLAKEQPTKTIFCLDPVICPCSTMYRIHPAYLVWVLEGLVKGEVVNQVKVEEQVAHWARVALQRMLNIS
ncbi:quinolinate synthase NadA [Dehalococcoidia bacterium]|nr:quinolinate synthase NadA [Dehalococcoidia bacterium]MCL0101623.1 quinolinate synthase NadA [Dehalococcoidia bacterium]